MDLKQPRTRDFMAFLAWRHVMDMLFLLVSHARQKSLEKTLFQSNAYFCTMCLSFRMAASLLANDELAGLFIPAEQQEDFKSTLLRLLNALGKANLESNESLHAKVEAKMPLLFEKPGVPGPEQDVLLQEMYVFCRYINQFSFRGVFPETRQPFFSLFDRWYREAVLGDLASFFRTYQNISWSTFLKTRQPLRALLLKQTSPLFGNTDVPLDSGPPTQAREPIQGFQDTRFTYTHIVFDAFLKHIESIYNPYQLVTALQSVLPGESTEGWKANSFFNQILKHRTGGFTTATTMQSLLCTDSQSTETFYAFLDRARTQYKNMCCGDDLDNAIFLRARHDIVLFTDSQGTLLNPVFGGTFSSQYAPSHQPELNDVVNILIDRFRDQFRRQYADSRLEKILDMMIRSLTDPERVETVSPLVRDDSFLNMPGVFWLEFHEYKVRREKDRVVVEAVQKNQKAWDHTREAFAKARLSAAKRRPGLETVQTLVVLECVGYLFPTTSAQFDVLQNRFDEIFSTPWQYESVPLRTLWAHQAPGTQNRDELVKQIFQEHVRREFAGRILEQKRDPLYVKMAHNKITQDLHEVLPLTSRGLKSRLFYVLGSPQLTRFRQEADLLNSLALFATALREGLFSSAALDGVLEQIILPNLTKLLPRQTTPTLGDQLRALLKERTAPS